MNRVANDAQLAALSPAASLWKLYDTPSYVPVSQMLQHFCSSRFW